MSFLSSLLGRQSLRDDNPLEGETGALFDALLEENSAEHFQWKPIDFSKSGKKIMALPDSERFSLLLHAAATYADAHAESRKKGARRNRVRVLQELFKRLMRRKMDVDQRQLATLIEVLSKDADEHYSSLPIAGALKLAEGFRQSGPLSDELMAALARLNRRLPDWYDKPLVPFREMLGRLLGETQVAAFGGRQAWCREGNARAEALEPAVRDAWGALLAHAATASSSRPSKKWLATAAGLVDALGVDRFAGLAGEIFGLIVAEDFKRIPLRSDADSDTIKGLVWMCSLHENDDLLVRVHELGEFAFRKVPGHGAGSSKVGNAVIFALGAQPGIAAISRLTALKRRVKYRQAQALIEKAMQKAAQERGLTVDTLEELAVPGFDLNESGRIEQRLGEFTAVVELGPGGSAKLGWRKPDGKPQKTVPKAVRDSHADELKALRAHAKDLAKTWAAQRDRVERLMLAGGSWKAADWRERYLDHPLMRTIARRLIWAVAAGGDETPVCHADEGLVDVTGKVVAVDDSAEISLWHPLGCAAEDVLAWRRFLEQHEITQPFKQAHREIYLLTDAERETRNYSNRFAGHVLRQHQLAALARERGWDYSLQGMFDSWNVPTKPLPDLGMRVEYTCEVLDTNTPASDMGIFLYVSTDQVRFIDSDGAPVALEEIPELVFSEIMRDVDLFVGVCSIGNDPNWMDGGERPAYGEYWEHFAFGELSETAKTRKAVLESIAPKLKIADRLSFDGRNLVVRGDIRTYRIHLGSGNIRMEPNDQYLCIVQGNRAGKAGERVLLPFEGDNLLSVILSKAAMLAADKKIKDPSILGQIRRR